MLHWQLFLCLGREVWQLTLGAPLSTVETKALFLTPLSLLEPEFFPAQEGAVGGKAPRGIAQTIMWPSRIPQSIRHELEARQRGSKPLSLHLKLPRVSCLDHPLWLPFPTPQPWLGASPSVLPSSETLNNSLPSFILFLWSITLSCSSRAFFF